VTIADSQLPTPIGCEHRPDIRCMDCYLRDTSPQNRQKHAQLNHAAREAAIERINRSQPTRERQRSRDQGYGLEL